MYFGGKNQEPEPKLQWSSKRGREKKEKKNATGPQSKQRECERKRT